MCHIVLYLRNLLTRPFRYQLTSAPLRLAPSHSQSVQTQSVTSERMALIWLKQPRLPRYLDLMLRWCRQIRTLNVHFAYAGLARTLMSTQRVTQLATRRVAPSGISGMTAMWMMTILEHVGWKTDEIGVPCPNGDPAHQLVLWAVTLVPGLYTDS